MGCVFATEDMRAEHAEQVRTMLSNAGVQFGHEESRTDVDKLIQKEPTIHEEKAELRHQESDMMMGLYSRKPTSNEPDTIDRTALLLRLDDEEARRYLFQLERQLSDLKSLVCRGQGIVQGWLMRSARPTAESYSTSTKWLREAEELL